MIFTLTLNPSLDYILKTPNFQLSQTNRATDSFLFAGGKGINVSLMLKNLGVKSKALGFLAGFSGQEIKRLLEKNEINEDFIFLNEGYSRINVKIFSQTETEINAVGPKIDSQYIANLLKKIEASTTDGDILVLSGSIPQGVQNTIYAEIMSICANKNMKIILDCANQALKESLKFHPFLVKPNKSEAEEFFGLKEATLDELKKCANNFRKLGAQNVILSLGKDGAIFANKENILHIDAPKGEVQNSVGAGDSMVAGMIIALERGMSISDAFLYAVSCGSASAFSDGFGDLEKVEEIFKTLKEKQ